MLASQPSLKFQRLVKGRHDRLVIGQKVGA
jgi:hypothetical protein